MALDPVDLRFIINSQEFQAELERIRQSVKSTVNDSKKDFDGLKGSFKELSKLAAGIFTANAAKDFITQMIAVRSELKDTETSFKVFLGSAERASGFMEELSRHAYNSVFEFKDIASGAASLLSYGAAAESVVPVLEKLSNIAAGTNQPLSNMIDLYNKAATSTKLMKQDLEQMQRNGIPVVRQLAEAYDRTEKEIWDMASAGRIGFKDVQVALDGLTTAGGMFFNMMEEKSKNLSDRIGLLQDSMTAMFNELGADNEDFLRTGIDSAIYLVEHYNEIIKILKVLVASYGIYRAALVANTLVLSRMTVLELLHYSRLVIVEKAQKLLNITTAANPYVAAAAALAMLSTALYVFADRATSAEKAQSRLNDIVQDANMAVVEETVKLNDLIRVAKDETKSKGEREKAIKAINNISPEYLGNLTLEKIGTKEATDAINEYIKALKTKAFEEAAYNERVAIEKERLALANSNDSGSFLTDSFAAFLDSRGVYGLSAKVRQNARKETESLLDAREQAINEEIEKRATENQSKQTGEQAVIKNAEYFQQIIDENTAALKRLDTQASDFATRAAPLKKAIREAQLALRAYELDKIDTAAQAQSKYQKVIDDLRDAERSALQSGMTQEEVRIDAINKRYDDLLRKAREVNAKPQVIQRIESARDTELENERLVQETELFRKELDRQKALFEQFEDYRKAVSLEAAQQRFKGEKADFESYSQYLQSEITKLEGNGTTNLVGEEKERLKLLKELRENAVRDEGKQRDNDYKDAFQAAENFEKQILRIKAYYAKMAADLGDPDNAELARQRDEAILAAEDEAFQRTEIFRRLNADILNLTREQISVQIELLNKALENDLISPESKAVIRTKIADLTNIVDSTPSGGRFWDVIMGSGFSDHEKQLKARIALIEESIAKEALTAEEIAHQTEEATRLKEELEEISSLKFQNLSSKLQEIAGAFNDIANSLPDTAKGAKDTLQTIAQLAQVGSDAAGSVASFMSGDIIGGISRGIRAITGVVNIFKAAKESAIQARKEVEAYYTALATGEYEYARLLRERKRDHEDINDLTRVELELRRQLLNAQTGAAMSEYERLLFMIQASGQQITGMTTEKYGGFLGIGRKTRSVEITSDLRGATYDQLEQMYTEGRLTEETRKWFEELQNVKNEVDDIDALLRAIDDLEISKFTGDLTAKSITDSITNGFKNGKRAVVDFGEDARAILQNALISGLAYTALEEPIKDLLKQFQDDADGGLTQSGIDKFNSGYNALVENFLKQADALDTATGGVLTGVTSGNGSPVSSSIERITQDQANALEGILRGLYDLTKQSLVQTGQFSKEHIHAVLEIVRSNKAIESNTGDMVIEIRQAVSELKIISKQTKPIKTGRDGGYG